MKYFMVFLVTWVISGFVLDHIHKDHCVKFARIQLLTGEVMVCHIVKEK